MLTRATTPLAIAAAAALAAPAAADLTIGQPLIVENDNTHLAVEFISYKAARSADLFFLGLPERDIPEQHLFSKPAAEPGDWIDLGTAHAGDRLDFLYHLTKGPKNEFRTDDPAGITQFGHRRISDNIIEVGVEDLKLPAHSQGNRAHDNMVFRVHMTMAAIPSPGAASVLLLAGALVIRRRRAT